MKAILVFNIERGYNQSAQRYYKLSEPLNKFKNTWTKELIALNHEYLLETHQSIKPEYKYLLTECEFNLICISDAHTHIERLAFLCSRKKDGTYARLDTQLTGTHTMMIHGGDTRRVYKDATYLRYLAKLNNLKWEGLHI
jgi:hypothetical protein